MKKKINKNILVTCFTVVKHSVIDSEGIETNIYIYIRIPTVMSSFFPKPF